MTCKGRVSRDGISTPFSNSQTFGPDDDFTPSAAIFFREIFAVNDAYEYGFYAYYCGDKDFRFLASLLNWENVPPLYKRKAIDEREELLVASKPIFVDLKGGKLQVEATCEYTKAKRP